MHLRRLARHRTTGHLPRPHRPELPRPGAAPAPPRHARRRDADRQRAIARAVLAGRRGRPADGRSRARERQDVRRAASRRLGSGGAAHAIRTATVSRPRSSTRRSACCSATTPTSTTSTRASRRTTGGSPSSARYAPDRLVGIGQTALRTPERGHRGPRGDQGAGPARRDAARHPAATPTTTIRCTTSSGTRSSTSACRRRSTSSRRAATRRSRRHIRGPKLNSFMSIIRGNQDIVGTFVFGAVFERHPELRVVCVEADAGLGAALHVPRGPRLRPPPQLADGRRAVDGRRASTSARTST